MLGVCSHCQRGNIPLYKTQGGWRLVSHSVDPTFKIDPKHPIFMPCEGGGQEPEVLQKPQKCGFCGSTAGLVKGDSGYLECISCGGI